MNPTVLLVVAKAPEPGLAKTRLSPAVGPEGAAELAAASLLDTLYAVRGVAGASTFVAWSGALDHAARRIEIAQALTGTTIIPQRGHELGERLAAAHSDVAKRAPGAAVLQIGMDTPQITSELLADCVAPLHGGDGPDAVLGAADDGGWWALGLRDPRNAALLRAVPMSRPDTGVRTSRALGARGLLVQPLAPLSDVDTIEDAERVAERTPESHFAAAMRDRAGQRR